MPSTQSLPFLIGHGDSGFESVRDAFLAKFEQGQEVRAAVAVYQRGRPVVDLAAGLRDRVSSARPMMTTPCSLSFPRVGDRGAGGKHARGSRPDRS